MRRDAVLLKLINSYIIWDSVVGILDSYGQDDRGFGVRVPVRSRIFFSPCRPDRFWRSPNLLSNFQGVKLPGREADLSSTASAEVKKMWISLHGVALN
jgi:hypothetical protein